MATSKQSANSLLTEHFRYTPLALLDDMINIVNEVIYRMVTAVESGLRNESPASLGFEDAIPSEEDPDGFNSPARREIENGVNQLETLLQATVDKNFDKLEIFVLRNILSVPEDLVPWMRLTHYENLDLNEPPPSEQPRPTPESLILLRRQLIETRKLNAALLAERAKNEAYILQLRSILESTDPSAASLSFLTEAPAAKDLGITSTPNGKTPLTDHARAAVAQLPALKELLAKLKSKAEDGALQYTRRNPAADERREFIETQVRQRLEKQGIDLRTGEGLQYQGQTVAGKRFGSDEVKAIEGVAGLFTAKQRTTNNEADGKMEE